MARLRWALNGGYVDRGAIAATFSDQRLRDPARKGHLAVAVGFCFLASFPTSVLEVAAVVLIAVFLIRLPRVAGLWIHGVGQPPYLLLTAWAAWWFLGVLWSPDRGHGFDELANLRWMLIPMAIWPVLDGRRWLIAALACGFVAGQLSQAAHGTGRMLGIEWITFDRYPERNSGWWDPVVGGSLLCVALGLHLPAALLGRGRARWVALAGATATLVGLLATGTRGAWAGGACLLVVALGFAGFRARRRLLRPLPLLAAGGACVVVAVSVSVFFREEFGRRAREGVAEVRQALVNQDFDSSTGGRLLMWRQAGRAMAHSPVWGVGTGGFKAWSEDDMGPGEADLHDRVHDHAHSAPLHAGATTGLIGLALGSAVVVSCIWGGMRMNPGERFGSYDAGPAFAVLGLALAGVFDTIQVNAQTAGMLGLLLGLCLPVRPRPAGEDEPTARASLADGLS